MWIKRDIEQNFASLIQEYPVVVLTGSRQVGKTALLEHLYGANNLISFDLPRVAAEAEAAPEAFLEKLPPNAILDEIQYVPSLFRPLKYFADRVLKPAGSNLFLTGSERFALMAGVTESLAGRAAVVELGTLSLRELERHTGQEASKQQLLDWMIAGGYPGLHASTGDRRRFFSNLVSTYIERDVRRLANVQDSRDFDRFMRLCANRTGQLLSMSGIAQELGVSQPTVKRWLNVLTASAIIDIVEPWHSNLNKRLVKTPKLYFNDTGLCAFLCGLVTTDELQRSSLLGPLFETACYGQLRRGLQNRGLQERIYFFRSRDGAEVDFIVPRGTEWLAYECKYSEHPAINQRNLTALEEATAMNIRKFSVATASRSSYPLDENRTTWTTSVVDLERELV